jgi:hypothetical protein
MVQLRRFLEGPNALPVLFALYALPRALLLLVPVEPTSDAEFYFSRARELAAGLGYGEKGLPTAYWPPGWPLTLGALFKVFGGSVLVGQLFNLAASMGTAWLTLDLGRRLFGSELAGRVALLLLALYPNHAAYVPLLLTETFYASLLLLGVWLLAARRTTGGRVAAGLVFGAASLVKAQSVVAVGLALAVIELEGGGGRSGRGGAKAPFLRSLGHYLARLAPRVAIVAGIALAVTFVWTWRNYRVLGEPVWISTNGGYTLLSGNNPSARGGFTPDDPLMASLPFDTARQIEIDREAKRRAVQWIRKNPVAFVKLLPLKAFRLWAPDGEASWGYELGSPAYAGRASVFRAVKLANQAYYVLLLAGFALAGALIGRGLWRWWRGGRKGDRPPWLALLPYAMVLYPTGIALLFSGQSRFHHPVMPFVAMECGWLCARLLASRSAGRAKARPAARASARA